MLCSLSVDIKGIDANVQPELPRKVDLIVHFLDVCVNTVLYRLSQVCALHGLRDVKILFGDVYLSSLVSPRLIKTFVADVCIFNRKPERPLLTTFSKAYQACTHRSVHGMRLLVRQASATGDCVLSRTDWKLHNGTLKAAAKF